MANIHTDVCRSLISKLAEMRAATGLTKQALADRLGKPQSYVAKVEEFEPRLDVVELLAMASKIAVDPMPIIEGTWGRMALPS